MFSRRYAIAIALTLLTIWLIRDRGPDLETIRDFAHLDGAFHKGGWISQEQFVKQALKDDIYIQGYNGTAVRKLCGEAQWREGLVVSCDQIAGGIGNLKMRVLGCVRYAVEAGGMRDEMTTSWHWKNAGLTLSLAMLVHPVIHPRQAFDLMDKSFGWDVDLPLDYIFDSEHFYTTLAEDCPQLRFVNESDPDLNLPTKKDSYPLVPTQLVATSMGGHVIDEPQKWRPALDKWIQEWIFDKEGHPSSLSNESPVRVSFDETVQFSWPNAYDGDKFKNDWGHVARFTPKIRELSARALYNLYRRLGCKQSPATVSQDCFLGVHIRTEQDAAVEHWDSYETQMQHAREQLSTHNLSAVYVATGTSSDVDRLRADLKDLRIQINATHDTPVQVLQKWDILDDEDMMIMDTLTWDQMALVDLDIMLRASRFEGIWESSWTWMIALKRHEWSNQTNPYGLGVTFEDGLSR